MDALDDLGRNGHRRWLLDATGMAVGAFLRITLLPMDQAGRRRHAQAGRRFFGWGFNMRILTIATGGLLEAGVAMPFRVQIPGLSYLRSLELCIEWRFQSAIAQQ